MTHCRPAASPALRQLPTVLLLITLLGSALLQAEEPVPVTAESVAGLAQFPVSSAPGTTVSLNDARLSAEITGTVAAVSVRVGDTVAAQDVLIRLDCDAYQFKAAQIKAQRDAAEARRELAAYQLQQVEKMEKGQFASAEEIMRRKAAARETAAQVRQLDAALKEAGDLVGKCELRAPFDGVVIERAASPGNLANPGTHLLRLVDSQDLEVSGQIQEQDLERLRAATEVVFSSATRRYPVKLRAVVPVVDTRLRSYEARFVFTAAKAAPGEAGRIEWQATTPHLPSDVLVRRDGVLGAFVVDDDRARFRPLAGAREGYPAPVTLADDVLVVIDGRFNLKDGSAVEVIKR